MYLLLAASLMFLLGIFAVTYIFYNPISKRDKWLLGLIGVVLIGLACYLSLKIITDPLQIFW